MIVRTALTDAEASFVGAVMHLPAATAATALALVDGDDFADPRLSAVTDACRALADRGIAPDPAAVLVHVRAVAVIGADALRSLSLLLADLYGTVPTPASVGWYRPGRA
jgi:hypothetical protein